MIAPQYECLECKWVGTNAEMGSDSVAGCADADEVWSNWICPGCGQWGAEDDYKKIVPIEDFTLEVKATIPRIYADEAWPKEIA